MALLYPSPGRLSSPSTRRAAPCSDWAYVVMTRRNCVHDSLSILPGIRLPAALLRKYRIQIAGHGDLILKAFDLLLLFWR